MAKTFFCISLEQKFKEQQIIVCVSNLFIFGINPNDINMKNNIFGIFEPLQTFV